jgi:serine/threonine protein phosphatase PrpC
MAAWRSRKHAGSPGEDSVAPVDPPTIDSAAVAPEWVAAGTNSASGSEVADVIGATAVPQIVVGSPSPSVEPAAIGAAYQSFPFRPDVVIDGWSTTAITVRGASQRGHLHRYNGAPRQDDFAVHDLPDGRVIVLVADGVSQAPQSHIGASTAIRTAAGWLGSNLGDDLADTDWMALLKNAAWALNERTQSLLGLGAPDPVRAEELLATTLVCAVIEPAGADALRAYLVGAGDSVAWLLSAGEFVEILAGKTVPDSGIASSAVVGLPRVPTELTPVRVDIAADDVLLIATDGIGDPLGTGHGGVGNLFREVLTGPSVPSLIEFAHAVDFSREAFDDDRTLVAVWPRKQVPMSSRTGRHSQISSPPDGLRGV